MTNPALHLFLPLFFSLSVTLSLLSVSSPSLPSTDPLPDDPGSKLGLSQGTVSADSCLPGHQNQRWSRAPGCAVTLQGGSKLLLINSSPESYLPNLYLTCSRSHQNTHTHTHTCHRQMKHYTQTNTAKRCAILTVHHNSGISWL